MVSTLQNPYYLRVDKIQASLLLCLYAPDMHGGHNCLWQTDIYISPREHDEHMLVGMPQFYHGNECDLLRITVRSDSDPDCEASMWLKIFDDGSVNTFASTGNCLLKRSEVPNNIVAVDADNNGCWEWQYSNTASASKMVPSAMSALSSLAQLGAVQTVEPKLLYERTNEAGLKLSAYFDPSDKNLEVTVIRESENMLLFRHKEDISDYEACLDKLTFCLDTYDKDTEKELLWINWGDFDSDHIRACSFFLYFWNNSEVEIVRTDGKMILGETAGCECEVVDNGDGTKSWRDKF